MDQNSCRLNIFFQLYYTETVNGIAQIFAEELKCTKSNLEDCVQVKPTLLFWMTSQSATGILIVAFIPPHILLYLI